MDINEVDEESVICIFVVADSQPSQPGLCPDGLSL